MTIRRSSRLDELTPMQQQITELVCEGLRNAQIGYRLGISSFTVANHLKLVYLKFGIHSRLELAVLCAGPR